MRCRTLCVALLALAVVELSLAAETTTRLLLCSTPGAPAFNADAAGVHAVGSSLAWSSGGDRVTALDCRAGRLAVGLAHGRRDGRVAVLEPGAGAFREIATIDVPRPPLQVVLAGERVAAVLPGAKNAGAELVLADIAGRKRQETTLPGPIAAAVAAPDETAILVATGRTVRTFRVDTGGTWIVYDFPDTVTALATRADVPWIAVAMGDRVVRVDPRDPAKRGVLPERAATTLEGEVRWLAVGARTVVAGVGGARPGFAALDAASLTPLAFAATAAAADAAAVVDDTHVLWSANGGAPETAAFADGALAAARAPHDAPLEPVKAPPASPPASPAAGAAAAGAAAVGAAAATGSAAAERVTPAPPVTPLPSPPSAAPEAAAGAAAAAPAPQPPPQPAPAAPANVPSAAATAPVPPPPAAPDPLPATLPAGTIAGRLSGHAELVTEIVIAGPDNIFAEKARVKPSSEGGAAVFRAEGLPPGRYRVTVMGAGGASLGTKPGIASVVLPSGAGVHVDFEIVGKL